MKHVDVAAVAMDKLSGTPVVLLREQDEPHRLLPILVGPAEIASIAYTANGETPDRPLTHDLLATLLTKLDASLDSIEVTELRDGTFFARLTLHNAAGEYHIDSRPSDAIALALRVDAPMLVSEDVLDEAGSLPAVQLDQDSIEETVEEFRSFLDDLDPSGFALPAASGDEGADDDDPDAGDSES